MAKYQLRSLQSPRRLGRGGAAAVALFLFAALAVRSECSATRPSNHGDKEPEQASPAMESFFHGHPDKEPDQASPAMESFHGHPEAAALPESANFTGGVSPAMATFFRGQPDAATAAELPEARNVPDPSSTSLQPPSPRRDRRSPVLIAVGVVCGILGFVLLVAVALAYAVLVRRSGRETEPGSGFALVRKESGSDIQLGVA